MQSLTIKTNKRKRYRDNRDNRQVSTSLLAGILKGLAQAFGNWLEIETLGSRNKRMLDPVFILRSVDQTHGLLYESLKINKI